MNYDTRFSAKADLYAQHRWGYLPDAFDVIVQQGEKALRVDANRWHVADIGAGGGEVSQHLVNRVSRVIAIEPNPQMRQKAIERLGQHNAFSACAAYAEATGLRSHSIDIITVGRAIHWFKPQLAQAEFARVLKPSGLLCILRLPTLASPLLTAVKTLQTVDYGWDMTAKAARDNAADPSYFYAETGCQRYQWQGVTHENWAQFFGRLCSLSVAPNNTHAKFTLFQAEAQRIFNKFSQNGIIHIDFATELFIGTLMPA